MKKFLLLLAAVGMIFTACEPANGLDEDNNGNQTEQPDGDNQGGEDNPDNPGDSQGGGNTTDPNNPLNNLTCAPNEILYTTKYGLVIELGSRQGFGGNLVYNTYEDGVGRLTFGNDVTAIPENAFKDCNSMEYIKMPNSVKSFGSNAFFNCTSLKSITIPDSVTSIGDYAFYDCTSLKSVTIGKGVTSIGEWAFCCCSSLTSVYCKPTTPPTGGDSMFESNATGRKIYVPTASVDAYKAATYWSDYASYIVGYNF